MDADYPRPAKVEWASYAGAWEVTRSDGSVYAVAVGELTEAESEVLWTQRGYVNGVYVGKEV